MLTKVHKINVNDCPKKTLNRMCLCFRATTGLNKNF